MISVRNRLRDRLPDPPHDEAIERLISSTDPKLLKVLALSGGWPTQAVGGEDVEVDMFFPADSATPKDTERPATPEGVGWKAAAILIAAVLATALILYLWLT
jgi:hypothetical protein